MGLESRAHRASALGVEHLEGVVHASRENAPIGAEVQRVDAAGLVATPIIVRDPSVVSLTMISRSSLSPPDARYRPSGL